MTLLESGKPIRMLKRLAKKILSDFYWRIYGRGLTNPPLTASPRAVLFICKGNICRSPFAEGYAIKAAKGMRLSECVFFSAGLDVSTADPTPREALLAAKIFGVDLDGHRSRCITEEMIASSDMVVAMEARQFLFLREVYPRFKDRIFLLPIVGRDHKKMGRGYASFNIADPYGKPSEQFQACFTTIAQFVDLLLLQMTGAEEPCYAKRDRAG